MRFLLWGSRTLTEYEREFTESIESSKTLTVPDGRVSIDPSEVLLSPGYLDDRRRAARLVKGATQPRPYIGQGWGGLSELGLDDLSRMIALRLRQSYHAGLGFSETIDPLKTMFEEKHL